MYWILTGDSSVRQSAFLTDLPLTKRILRRICMYRPLHSSVFCLLSSVFCLLSPAGPRPPRSRSGTTPRRPATTRPSSRRPSSAAKAPAAVAAAQAARRARRHPRLGRRRGRRRQPVRGHRRRRQDLQGHARRQGVASCYTSEDSQVLCLARRPTASVYAGTGPSGQIVRIDADGKPRSSPTSSATTSGRWRSIRKGKTLYAGTGPKGRIYRVTPDGKASVFYQTKQEHILCLGSGRTERSTPAPTRRPGLPHRRRRQGLRPLPRAADRGPRCLVAHDGAVYAGTRLPLAQPPRPSSSVQIGRRLPLNFTSRRLVRRRPATRRSQTSRSRTQTGGIGGGSRLGTPKEGQSPSPPRRRRRPRPARTPSTASPPTAPSARSSAKRRWSFALCATAAGSSSAPAWKANSSRSTRRPRNAARSPASITARSTALLHRKDGSHRPRHRRPGQALRPQDRYAAKGTVMSEVLDAKIISKWGALTWKADTPAGTAVTVAVRSGNVAEPDETWSDWSAEQTDAARKARRPAGPRSAVPRDAHRPTDPTATPTSATSPALPTTNQAPEVTTPRGARPRRRPLDNPKKLKLKWNADRPERGRADLQPLTSARKAGRTGCCSKRTSRSASTNGTRPRRRPASIR